MPRTKQVRKKSSVVNRLKQNELFASHESPVDPLSAQAIVSREYESANDFLDEFNTYYDHHKQKNELAYKRIREEVESMFSNILEELPDVIKLSNVHSEIAECYVGDENQDLNTTDAPPPRIARPLKPINTSEFKMPKAPPRASSRSSTRKCLPPVTQGQPPPPELFKTPSMNSRRLPQSYATITPKVYNDNPITVMRRPLHGELAISLDGSPLMVGPTSREDIPTVNVPLVDGKIFSIMPEEGTPPNDLPHFDETTKKYLKTLRDHLRILAPNSPVELNSH